MVGSERGMAGSDGGLGGREGRFRRQGDVLGAGNEGGWEERRKGWQAGRNC